MLAALGVTDDRATCACVQEHRRADLSRERSALLGCDVLGEEPEGSRRPGCGLHAGQGDEGWGDADPDGVAVDELGGEARSELTTQGVGLGPEQVLLPVADDPALALRDFVV